MSERKQERKNECFCVPDIWSVDIDFMFLCQSFRWKLLNNQSIKQSRIKEINPAIN